MGVSFRHHDVSIGFHDVEGTLLDEIDHGFVKGRLHGREVIHLVVVQVNVHCSEESWRHLVVDAFGGVGSVTFCELPDEHRRQVVLTACKQHVSCCGNS